MILCLSQQEAVTQLRYPCPDGWKAVTLQEVNTYWGDVQPQEVLVPQSVKKLSKVEIGNGPSPKHHSEPTHAQ